MINNVSLEDNENDVGIYFKWIFYILLLRENNFSYSLIEIFYALRILINLISQSHSTGQSQCIGRTIAIPWRQWHKYRLHRRRLSDSTCTLV